MKAWYVNVPTIVACCLVVMLATGCEDNSSPAPNPPSVDVTGTWGMQTDLTDVHTMVLSQSGNNITGSVSTFVGQTSTIVGIISDISITMFMSSGTSNIVNFVGLASKNSMSGTWSDSNSQAGNWTAVRK